jgi:acetyltransferase-like isoleucine patch superfamily enzyme
MSVEANQKFTLYPGVTFGEGSEVGEGCQLGVPFSGSEGLKTVIGKRAKIRSNTIIYAGNSIGDDFQTGHAVLIRENNIIGNNVSIGSQSIIEHSVRIEDNARCHSGVFVPEFSHLKKGSWLGPRVVLTNASYPKSKNAKQNLKGCTVEENAKIGANSTLLPGVSIGANSLVGAGSVVTKSVAEGVVVAGNPARQIKKIADIPEYE